jgi:hypothetical protein
VHHQQRTGGGEFDGEVAIRHGVERVFADRLETELGGDGLAVDRIGRAGQRGGAQRQAVDALAAVGEALAVAAEHLEVGQHVVAEGHRLRHLQVGEAGHRRGRLLFGEIDQRAAELLEQHLDVVDGVAQVEADVGRHLVVARAAGVQAFSRVADERGQALLDVQVHVLQVERPFEPAGFDLALHGFHAALDVDQVARADDALPGQHPRMRQRAADVLPPHAPVEIDRGRIALDEIGDGLRESSGPGVLCGAGSHRITRSRRSGIRNDKYTAVSGNASATRLA